MSKTEIGVALLLIIGLISVFGPRIFSSTHVDGVCEMCADMRMLESTLSLYYLDTDRYPESLNELITESGRGPYLKKIPIDEWNYSYYYSVKNGGASYLLGTLGLDGVIGGEGESADYYYKRESCACS